MSTNQSLLKLEAEKCKSVPTAREQAEAILARMNDMLRDRSFFEVHVEKKFNQLNESIIFKIYVKNMVYCCRKENNNDWSDYRRH